MAKLKDKQAKAYLKQLMTSLTGAGLEVYECDKGCGNMCFIEEGDNLPSGWVTKRSAKGVFHICPNHGTVISKKDDMDDNG